MPQADPALIETILSGGDDHEILLTLPQEKLPAFRALADHADVAVTEIGRIIAGEGARFFAAAKNLLSRGHRTAISRTSELVRIFYFHPCGEPAETTLRRSATNKVV